MKTTLLRFIRQKQTSEKQKFKSKKTFWTFLICVFVAIIFWFLTFLTRNYNGTINFPIHYNHPENKILIGKLPASLAVEVNARGLDLLTYHFKSIVTPLNLDVTSSQNIKSINYFSQKISTLLGKGITILHIYPDSIRLDVGERFTKKIPVKVNLLSSYKKQYGLSDSIKVMPDSIIISGAKSVIENIHEIKTEPLKLLNLSENVSTTIHLLQNKKIVISLSDTVVKLLIPVEKFTEENIEIPVEKINFPLQYKAKIFPEKISVTFLVTLSNYEKVKFNLFSAIADYNTAQGNKLKITLAKYPDFIKVIKFHPKKTEYLILK